TPEAEIKKEDVFSNYPSFQGYMDVFYHFIFSGLSFNQTGVPMDLGGEFYNTNYVESIVVKGDYWHNWEFYRFLNPDRYYPYGIQLKSNWGIWGGGWRAIRGMNLALENLHLLKDGTDEQRRLIEGQSYFFRGYHHGEIIAVVGGMPFV